MTLLRQKIFIAFLDELGNFKPFESYLFFCLICTVRRCGTAQAPHSAVRVRESEAECGNGLGDSQNVRLENERDISLLYK